MELATSSKVWVTIYWSTQHHVPEDLPTLYTGCCTNFPGELHSYKLR